jgi:hypothetical protein
VPGLLFEKGSCQKTHKQKRKKKKEKWEERKKKRKKRNRIFANFFSPFSLRLALN